MVAQTKGGHASLNTNKDYVYECNGSYYQFYPDGTGIVNFDYTIDFDDEFKFTWKKKTAKVVTITRDVVGEKVVYDVKIISNTNISINEYGDKWSTYVLKKKSKLLDD